MESLYDAIEYRFKADAALVKAARRVYLGFEGEPLRSVFPYVDVSISGPASDNDTFDADIESVEVLFTIFGKNMIPADVYGAMSNLMRVFDDCNLQSSEFTASKFHRTGGDHPTVNDSVYRASLAYEVVLHMAVLEPPVRAT